MARKRTLLLSEEAVADLDAIADPLFSAVRNRLLLLQDNPEMGQAMTGGYAGWRPTPGGIFRIFCRITKRGIGVVYVRHCKRQLPQP